MPKSLRKSGKVYVKWDFQKQRLKEAKTFNQSDLDRNLVYELEQRDWDRHMTASVRPRTLE